MIWAIHEQVTVAVVDASGYDHATCHFFRVQSKDVSDIFQSSGAKVAAQVVCGVRCLLTILAISDGRQTARVETIDLA